MVASANAPCDPAVAPLNFIYACSICCASLADVYEGHDETVQGLSDGINPKERVVTRLFLAGNCCHVFCANHLDGGGPSFHPAGQRPKAPCPFCVKENGDTTARDLYSVRGFNKDEYDPHIPSTWFTAPPIRLDGNSKEMEALRFQYLALIRYCQNTYATWKPMQISLSEIEQKLASMQQLASEEHAKVLILQQENDQLRTRQDQFDATQAELRRLQGLEDEVNQYRRLRVNPHDLETFVANKAAIRHYLKLVPMLIEQNDKMKRRLAQLGFAMALEPVPNFKGIDPNAFSSDDAYPDKYRDEPGALPRKTSSSQTVGRSAHTSGRLGTAPSSPFTGRPLKRQRVDSPLPDRAQVDLPSSRDAMPPPSKPVSRMQSVRGIIPTLRKKFSHGHWAPAHEGTSTRHDVQMHETEHWPKGSNMRPITRNGAREDAPYMSGALPTEQVVHTQGTRTIVKAGVNGRTSEFTFRSSSPIKLNKLSNRPSPVQLPTEPSYIRLMDGLSRNTDFQIGLTDPRESSMKDHDDGNDNRQVMTSSERRHQNHKVRGEERRNLGHSAQHRSHPAPSYSTPNDDVRFLGPRQINETTHRPYEPLFSPVTPAPARYQQPGHKLESVVSPFFERSQYQAPPHSRTGFAEPQDSSRRFDAYQSPRTPKIEQRTSWREPRSLNGLSFFDSPVNSRNEPIEHSHRQGLRQLPSSQHYRSQGLAFRGLVEEPEEGRSSFVRPSYTNQSVRHTQALNPPASYNRSSFTHTVRPSSVALFDISAHIAAPIQQWEALQRTGVRSSRNTYGNIAMKPQSRSTKDKVPTAVRRSVRR